MGVTAPEYVAHCSPEQPSSKSIGSQAHLRWCILLTEDMHTVALSTLKGNSDV